MSGDHVCEGVLMSKPKVAVIGLGLMGASCAAALRKSGAVGQVIGYDLDPANNAYCTKKSYVDHIAESDAEAAAQADVVIIAVPVDALSDVAKTIAPHLREGAVVTDISSVKQEAVAAIAPHLPETVDFVPGHPIAGKSTKGPKGASHRLFEDKLAVLTPEKGVTPDRAVAAVARLWEAMGAKPERMSAGNHDILYGYTSHLPQLMAYAACQTLGDETLPEHLPETFARFVRLGESDPELWRDICTANREPVRHALGHVLATVDHMLDEFAEGAAKGNDSKDDPHVASKLFPMLASAALISVIAQFEVQNELHITPYAGTGFRDFSAPASADPNDDLEAISESYGHVSRCLTRFRDTLHAMHTALGDPTPGGKEAFGELLENAHASHGQIAARMGAHSTELSSASRS